MNSSPTIRQLALTVRIAVTSVQANPRKAVLTPGSFEDETLPNIVFEGQPGLSLNEDHFKDGKFSLQWDFTAGEQFRFSHGQDAIQSVSIWVYLRTPRPNDSLTVSLDESGAFTRSVGLNFKGWRRFVLAYNKGKFPQEISQQITFTPPESEGTIFLDLLEFNVPALASLEGDINPKIK